MSIRLEMEGGGGVGGGGWGGEIISPISLKLELVCQSLPNFI